MAQGNGNGRSALVDRCKALIAEAYQEATEMIVAYLERHPTERRATLCKEIDPDNWSALEARVRRVQEIRRSVPVSGTTDQSRAIATQNVRTGRSAIKREPALASELLKDPEVRNSVRKALIEHDSQAVKERSQERRHDPTTANIDGHKSILNLSKALDDHAAKVAFDLAHVGSLDDGERIWLRSALERSEAANTEVRFYVEHGETRIDAEIRALA